MKTMIAYILSFSMLSTCWSVELTTLDGTTIKGTVTTNDHQSVTVLTEYGSVQIPAEKLTTTSRFKAGLGLSLEDITLEERVKTLERENKRILDENRKLRAVPPPVPSAEPSPKPIVVNPMDVIRPPRPMTPYDTGGPSLQAYKNEQKEYERALRAEERTQDRKLREAAITGRPPVVPAVQRRYSLSGSHVRHNDSCPQYDPSPLSACGSKAGYACRDCGG